MHWDEEAEALHGITREMLNNHGLSPIRVCHELNHFLSNTQVYSDGWVVDNPWLIKLYAASGVEMSFTCRALDYVLNETQMEYWHQVKSDIEDHTKDSRHRASTDALIIQKTFVKTKQRA